MTSSSSSARTRPFLKWVGSKRRLVPELLKWVPASYSAYHESFLGGGALFFAIRPKHAVLSDANARLIKTYIGVRDHVENVIGMLNDYYIPNFTEHGKAFYNHVRSMCPDHLGPPGVAAWFIFTNRTGFNGLYRVNKSGQFNVPMGRYTNPTICDAENLRACSAALQGAEILHRDFRVGTLPVENHLFYYDSPYVPLSATSGFTAYTTDGFAADDQTALRDLASLLKKSGAHVLLSNSTAARPLYTDPLFEIREVKRGGGINSDTTKRGAVTELIIR